MTRYPLRRSLVRRLLEGCGIAAIALFASIVAPGSASAEGLIATISNLEVKPRDDFRQITIRVNGNRTCGNNPATATLYWRDSIAKTAYEDGVKLLTGALLSGAGLVFDVTDTGSACRVNGLLVAQPVQR